MLYWTNSKIVLEQLSFVIGMYKCTLICQKDINSFTFKSVNTKILSYPCTPEYNRERDDTLTPLDVYTIEISIDN